jgi:hypothetical protein
LGQVAQQPQTGYGLPQVMRQMPVEALPHGYITTMIPMLATPDTPAPTLPVQYSGANRSDVIGEYVAAEHLWHQACASTSSDKTKAAAAHDYVRAIDAYVVTLTTSGRQVPYRLDEISASLRATYGAAA